MAPNKVAAKSDEALSFADSEKPTLAIMDVRVPEQLCREAPDHLNAEPWRSGAVALAARGGRAV